MKEPSGLVDSLGGQPVVVGGYIPHHLKPLLLRKPPADCCVSNKVCDTRISRRVPLYINSKSRNTLIVTNVHILLSGMCFGDSPALIRAQG